jgi:DNA-binding NtrC family response regulator
MSPTSADVKSQLLLVVDDDILRGRMADFFSRDGYVVEQCADGHAALELADRRVFDVLVLVERCNWSGNVRLLEEAVQRGQLLADRDRISIENLSSKVWSGARLREGSCSFADLDLDTLNKLHIAETFRRHDGNKARTARALGIGRRTLYRLLQKYGIEPAGMG